MNMVDVTLRGSPSEDVRRPLADASNVQKDWRKVEQVIPTILVNRMPSIF